MIWLLVFVSLLLLFLTRSSHSNVDAMLFNIRLKWLLIVVMLKYLIATSVYSSTRRGFFN